MFDRVARDKLIEAISEYLNDTVTAFVFDEHLYEIATTTKDETVCQVVDALWFYYDDCKDHKVVLTKEQWNYFQRLILLLQSDSHIHVTLTRHWSVRQAIALAALGCCLVFLFIFDMSYWFIAVPFGFVSMALGFMHRRQMPQVSATEIALTPFSSVSEIRAALRRSPHFRKRRYPSGLADRKIRSDGERSVLRFHYYALWLFASPFVLFFQALPDTQTTLHVEAAS